MPLSLAVGFAMIASYILSSTFVPVLSVWLLKPESERHDEAGRQGADVFENVRSVVSSVHLPRIMAARWLLVARISWRPACLILVGGAWWLLGREIFPVVDAGQFRLRMRAPDGTHIARTEQYAKQALQ